MVIVTLAGGPAVARALALRNGRNERTFASPFAQRRRESSQRRAVQLVELTPQHLRIEVRRVTSGCAFRWFERFPEMPQRRRGVVEEPQAFDVVSFDDAEEWSKDHDQRAQLETATAVGANLNVNLKCAAHQLSVRSVAT